MTSLAPCRFAEGGHPKVSPVGDSRSGDVVHSLDRDLGKQRFSPQECIIEFPLIAQGFQLLQRVSALNHKLPHGGAAKTFDMSADTELLSEFMRQRAHIGAGGATDTHFSPVSFHSEQLEFEDVYGGRLQTHGLVLAR